MSELRIDARSQSLLWGIGLFETMLVIAGSVVFETRHFERMATAARELGIPEPSPDAWRNAIAAALRVSPATDELALRCSWLDPGPGAAEWTFVATAFEVPPVTLERRRRGRVVLLPPRFRRTMPRYKSLSHLASVIGLRKAREAGADEGLFTSGGGILEGTATNVFAIDGKTLLTPPVEAGILPGIVRAWVIENASRAGCTVSTRLVDREDLRRGSFLTSSLTLLCPIRTVDGEMARDPGDGFRELARLFDDDCRASAAPRLGRAESTDR